MNNKISKKGFTLLELLAVISIIIILAGIIMPSMNAARSRAYVAKTKSKIAALELALSMYEADVGDFPLASDYSDFSAWWLDGKDILHGKSNPTGWEGPYIEFKEDEVENSFVLDAWGNPFLYRTSSSGIGGPKHRYSYDLYSIGSDGNDEFGLTGDDVTNWKG